MVLDVVDARLDRVKIVLPDDFLMPPGGLNIRTPDGILEQEIDPTRETINHNDNGLDGKGDAQEIGVRWECKPLCYSIPLDSNNNDPGGDNYKQPVGATEEAATVNGTQGNNTATGGLTYDTEDLDRSGTLDQKNVFLRYTLPLDSACSARSKETHVPSLRCHVSGLWQYKQRRRHPLMNTTTRTPGPSKVEPVS